MENPVVALLNGREASRAIDGRALDEEVMGELAEAVRLTPSCFNNQPWRYLFLATADALAQGGDAVTGGNRAWAPRAPLLIVGYTCKSDDCVMDDGRAYHQFDLGMSVMNLILAATQRGLIARPMAGFDPEKIRRAFGLQTEDEPLIMIAVGFKSDDDSFLPEHYQKSAREPRTRKVVSEVVKRL